jgi:signal transduction histidine kinase
MRPRRLGLRARITLAFALGSFALSGLLAGTTYLVTRQTLLNTRENAVMERAYINARLVSTRMESADVDVQVLLRGLQTPSGSRPVVEDGGRWIPLDFQFGENALPPALRATVEGGQAARMRYTFNGESELAIGIPLPAVDASYYEIVSMEELADTLRSLSVALVSAAAVCTLLGTTLGLVASRRAVRPLADAARAAEAIAGGRLDTRLHTSEDRDLARLTESFNDMAAALQARVERDARFASDVSHELRSPLMTLAASVEILNSRRDELPERAVAALDLLTADIARFQSLVEDLLEISRVDAGAIRLHLEDVSASEFVHNVVAASGHRVPVVVAPDAAGVIIRADKRRLMRALANLLDNAAIHATGPQQVVVEADAAGEGDDPGWLRIAVDDDGPGVPPEERTLVFERFARGTGAGRRGFGDGAGLGLALVDEHVRLHGGRVWVEDPPSGQGARFVIELPVIER